MKLRLVPSRPTCFEQYKLWCDARGRIAQDHFLTASGHLWVEAEGHGLVLGVALYESPGFCMAEELVGSHTAPPRVIHAALKLAIQAYLQHCTVAGRFPLIHPTTRGLVRVLARFGFGRLPCVAMMRAPFWQTRERERPKPAPAPEEKPKPKRRRRLVRSKKK